jgi:TPR repeat protein
MHEESPQVREYRRSAAQGDMEAQFQLARCYAEGHGVERDPEEAFKWFRQAAKQGHQESRRVVEELRQAEAEG